MEKKDLIKFLDGIFIKFKRKGNNWILKEKEITKIVNLQKSQYSNAYYLNYGYIVNSLPLNNFVNHIDNRLCSKDKGEQELITDLLNLENDFDYSDRLILLHKLINEKIILEMLSVHTEDDIVLILQKREHLYTIPPFVLKHFNIAFEW